VPVVGMVEVHPQREYRERSTHQVAHEAMHRLIHAREMAVVPIDTRLDINGTGLRTPAEVESLIARMDVVLTTRLHGMVLALKNGVPAIAIDPIAGGAKIRRQADTIGWPMAFTVDRLGDEELQKAYDYCLTMEARAQARACVERAVEKITKVRAQFVAAFMRDRQKQAEK
jgi:exopolysaccharide biosynthesis predicted pyruvyltransferase EpsI